LNKKVLFSACALWLGLSGYAGVYTVSYNVTAPTTPAVTPGTPGSGGTLVNSSTFYSVPIPQWDAATVPNPLNENLELIGVSYTMTSIFYGTYSGSWTSNGGPGGTGTLTFDFTPNSFSFEGPGGALATFLEVAPGNFGASPAARRIRVVVSGLARNQVTAGTTTTKASTSVTADEDVGNLSFYVGNGTVDLSFNQDVTSSVQTSTVGANGQVSTTSSLSAFSSSLITVTYTYIPETGTVAGAGALALGIGVVGWRRRRG
jgi:hypothetical protein